MDGLAAVSNEGFSLKELTLHIQRVMDGYGDSDGFIFMVEFKGGSGFMAVMKAIHGYRQEHPTRKNAANIGVITGINMPILVTFVTKRESMAPGDLLIALREEGVNGVTIDHISTGNEDL